MSHPITQAFYPLSLPSKWHRADNPDMTIVYMNLQPPDDTARRSPAGWWSLTPPSHPYQTCPRATVCGQKQFPAVILFCLTLLSPIASIFGSGVPYAARTFLSPHHMGPAAGPGICFPDAKIAQNMRYRKQKRFFLLF